MDKMKFISVTQLKLFEQCRARYQHRYVLREPDEQSFHTIFGSLIHAVLEAFHADRSMPLLERYQQEFQKPVYRVLDAELFEKGRRMLEDYQLTDAAQPDRKVLAVEQAFEGHLPNGVPVRAVLDRIDQLDETTIEVRDYKTGTSHFPTQYELQSDEQLSMYDVIARQLYPWATTVKLTLQYFKGETLTTERRPDQREAFLEYVAAVYQDMTTTKDFPPTLNTYCGYCPYKAQCSAYQAAVNESAEASIAPCEIVPGTKLATKPFDLSLPDDLPKIAMAIEHFRHKQKVLDQAEKDLQRIILDFMENQQTQALQAGDYVMTSQQKEFTPINTQTAFHLLPQHVFLQLAKVGKEKVDEYIQSLKREGKMDEAAKIELGIGQGRVVSYGNPSLKIEANKMAKRAKRVKAIDKT